MTADTDAVQAIVIAREVARERLEAATAQPCIFQTKTFDASHDRG
jgi:hypothetical protein